MVDTSAALEAERSTVAASGNDCLEAFQKCLRQAASIGPRELSMVEDQVARFSTWATSIGVFAHGRASMDHRLRYAPEVQSVLISLLESLNYRVQTCEKLLGTFGESPEMNLPCVLRDSFTDIGTEIGYLNKTSNTIRRAGKESQNLRAREFHIKDDDGNDVESDLLYHFERFIRDRFPNIGNIISQRLAATMILRWKRVLYRRHQQGTMTTLIKRASLHATAARNTQQDTHMNSILPTMSAPSRATSATTLYPERFKTAELSISVTSSSKTIALGKHKTLDFPPHPHIRKKRKYADANLNGISEEELWTRGELDCPYCLHSLPVDEVVDEKKWQNHVKNDLEPYVCLFENCDQSDEIYRHSDEWLNHMRQHSRSWRCSAHQKSETFSTSAEYINHMHEVHKTKLSDTRLRVLANINSRCTTKLFSSCPLCGDKSEKDLEAHIVGHLRSLALKSLPSYQDEILDDGSANDSVSSEQPQSRSTVKDLNEGEDISQSKLYHYREDRTSRKDTDDSNFLGDAYQELSQTSEDSKAASWDLDVFANSKSFPSTDDDPIIRSMLQRKKEEEEKLADTFKAILPEAEGHRTTLRPESPNTLTSMTNSLCRLEKEKEPETEVNETCKAQVSTSSDEQPTTNPGPSNKTCTNIVPQETTTTSNYVSPSESIGTFWVCHACCASPNNSAFSACPMCNHTRCSFCSLYSTIIY